LFQKVEKRMPGAWDKKDADTFFDLCKQVGKRYDIKEEELKEDS